VTAGGAWLLRVEARDDGGVAALADVGAEVEAEWRRRQGDRRLREVLDDERREARVVLARDLEPVGAGEAEHVVDVDEVPR
jgi:hypothetical protein